VQAPPGDRAPAAFARAHVRSIVRALIASVVVRSIDTTRFSRDVSALTDDAIAGSVAAPTRPSRTEPTVHTAVRPDVAALRACVRAYGHGNHRAQD
jgi:hypothetical protein